MTPPHLPVLHARLGGWVLRLERARRPASVLRDDYDRLAEGWSDRRARWGFDAAYGDLLGWLQPDLVRGLAAGPLLDVGCGDGGFTEAAALRVGPLAEVHLVDLSTPMMAVATRRLGPHARAVHAHRGDVDEALPDGPFGVILAGHVLEHTADPVALAGRLAARLAPGGILVAVVTRCGILGRWIQATWGVHCFSAPTARRLLAPRAVEVHALPTSSRWARQASLAWIARAPLSGAAPPSRTHAG